MNGVDFSSITALSGKSLVDSGVATVPATTDTGIVVCPFIPAPKGPFDDSELADYVNYAHMYQLSTATGVVAMVNNYASWGYLLSNGEFYTGGWGNASSLGLGSTDAYQVTTNGGLRLSLSNVSKVQSHSSGFIAIKTDGTLWWCGNIGNYLDTTGTGQSTTSSSNGWLQIGSDTDWYDIKCFSTYPYTILAIKGSAGSRYVYSCGYNVNYNTGLGTNSGTTKQFTRVKSAASTDLSESIAEVATCYGSCAAITDSGKLFTWGEAGQGVLGNGSTTDKPYATQIGSDTDWDKVWVQRYGSFAMKTNGTMYMSTGTTAWRIEPSSDRTFTQIGSDTDYEDMRVFDQTSNSMDFTVLAKKNGSWYVSASTSAQGAWHGKTNGNKTATTNGSWVSLNTYLEKNEITGTIDDIMLFGGASAQGEPAAMFALS